MPRTHQLVVVALALALGAHAQAAPTFTSELSGAADYASQAWDAATTCAGWEPEAAPVVPIVNVGTSTGFAGRAHVGNQGLKLIELAHGVTREERTGHFLAPLAHEVAHAWVHGGLPGLREGRTELLADCIREAIGAPGADKRFRPKQGLEDPPDLRTWTTDEATGAGYLASYNLAKVLASQTPSRTLWAPRALLSWSDLEALLARAGPSGETILQALSTRSEQAVALSDQDADGLPELLERFLGTDPDVWDTDLDGWWDGASPPEQALPLPTFDHPLCLGVASTEGSRLQLSVGAHWVTVQPPE